MMSPLVLVEGPLSDLQQEVEGFPEEFGAQVGLADLVVEEGLRVPVV